MKAGDWVKIRVRKSQKEPRTETRNGVTVISHSTAEFYPLQDVTGENNTYEVGGIDSRGRIWLSLIDVNDGDCVGYDYNGYNGDVILLPCNEDMVHEVMLADERSAFGFDVKLDLLS